MLRVLLVTLSLVSVCVGRYSSSSPDTSTSTKYGPDATTTLRDKAKEVYLEGLVDGFESEVSVGTAANSRLTTTRSRDTRLLAKEAGILHSFFALGQARASSDSTAIQEDLALAANLPGLSSDSSTSHDDDDDSSSPSSVDTSKVRGFSSEFSNSNGNFKELIEEIRQEG
eukprot:CAMPEP_0170739366 /NCGR_PEP_ID=MMETSP0437-20130122/5127_1 /TAXON_ID=0 /ORGANISM="Sexangularia sp." /LENGTH=169 /DNA_ID=CAMNT_0011077825 /DNA_START=70 /DNA_END=579 /DNA_ORIENTATION=-